MEKNNNQFEQAVDWIYSFTNLEDSQSRTSSKFNLDVIERLLKNLNNPHKNQNIIHIAGTKGKGSTSAYVASILTENGYTTALFQSPHLFSICERFNVNGANISENKFVSIVQILQPIVEKMGRNGEGKPTTFDLMTAIAFIYFHQEKAQIWVIETGLGGRLDSTNIVTPLISVITKIGIDHVEILGSTIAEIAYEKGGIIKEKRPVVLSRQAHAQATQIIHQIAKAKNCEVRTCGEISSFENRGLTGQRRSVVFHLGEKTLELKLRMAAIYQLENAETALVTIFLLKKMGFAIRNKAITKAFADTDILGRFSVLQKEDVTVVIDGAHNVEATVSLLDTLKEQYANESPRVLLFGTSVDKDGEQMLKLLVPFFQHVTLTQSNNTRALPARVLLCENQKLFCDVSLQTEENMPKALTEALKLAHGGLLCICGSLFLAAQSLSVINDVQY